MTEQPIEQNKQLEVLDSSQDTCTNCQAPLDGPYCGQCGQAVNSTLKYFGSVILHLLEDIFSFDSRAKRTLIPLLTKPGFLTKEYFAGKRVHYVPPLRLYLFISIVFFLSLTVFVEVSAPEFGTPIQEIVVEELQEEITRLEAEHLTQLDQSLARNDKIKTEQEKQLIQLKAYLANIEKIDHNNLKDAVLDVAYLTLKTIDNPETLTEDQTDYINSVKDRVKIYQAAQSTEKSTKNNFFKVGNNTDGGIDLSFLSAEQNKILSEQVDILVSKANATYSTDPSQLIQQAISKLPQLMFVLLPLFALLLKIMFIFSKRLFMEHLTVALHSHSFIFLMILILVILDRIQEMTLANMPLIVDGLDVIAIGLLLWIPLYLFLMQKRVYQQGIFMTTIKYMIISTLYLFMITFTAMAAFVWGLTNI